MQYCSKCRNICEDKLTVCPNCKRTRFLKKAEGNDEIFLMKVRSFEADEISEIFDNYSIRYSVEPFSMGHISTLYDSEVLPDDKNIYVSFDDIDRAKELIKDKQISEYDSEIDGVPDTMSKKKRIISEIIAVLVFLILVVLVVFASDAVAGGIKDFLQSYSVSKIIFN